MGIKLVANAACYYMIKYALDMELILPPFRLNEIYAESVRFHGKYYCPCKIPPTVLGIVLGVEYIFPVQPSLYSKEREDSGYKDIL